ncbi:MAG: hypothetical protein ACLSVG_08790 [Clostridia bacterium]
MKKLYNLVFIIVFIICLLMNNGCKPLKKQQTKETPFISPQIVTSKESPLPITFPNIDLMFKDNKTLTYSDTIEIPSRLVDAANENLLKSEKNFDVFIDEYERGYLYFGGTSVQCGFMDNNVYGIYIPEDNLLTVDEIKELSLLYLKKITKNSDHYTLVSCEYKECEMIYLARYNYQIQGVNTDDDILFYFRGDGSLGAYTTYHINQYLSIEIDKDLKEMINQIKNEKSLTLTNTFVTKYYSSLYLVVEGFLSGDTTVRQFTVKL